MESGLEWTVVGHHHIPAGDDGPHYPRTDHSNYQPSASPARPPGCKSKSDQTSREDKWYKSEMLVGWMVGGGRPGKLSQINAF